MANDDRRKELASNLRHETVTKVTPLRKPVQCPNCSHKSHRETYPFCSVRCQDVDLNKWFSGSYAIPAVENDHGLGDE